MQKLYSVLSSGISGGGDISPPCTKILELIEKFLKSTSTESFFFPEYCFCFFLATLGSACGVQKEAGVWGGSPPMSPKVVLRGGIFPLTFFCGTVIMYLVSMVTCSEVYASQGIGCNPLTTPVTVKLTKHEIPTVPCGMGRAWSRRKPSRDTCHNTGKF